MTGTEDEDYEDASGTGATNKGAGATSSTPRKMSNNAAAESTVRGASNPNSQYDESGIYLPTTSTKHPIISPTQLTPPTAESYSSAGTSTSNSGGSTAQVVKGNSNAATASRPVADGDYNHGDVDEVTATTTQACHGGAQSQSYQDNAQGQTSQSNAGGRNYGAISEGGSF
ncbi:hypothetical protein BDV29DRAFT_160989 [Aspergillus leporis]|uniref:Uncharacterized protein n=1 Tax=Aspergillus leporis TaxID=41062 RepID=A0A5N5WRU4_9EURO|nr:hypothetical protein BDV29DRAFT_160989 [Aspergillus leporis]